MGMISKRVVIAAVAALLFVGSVALAGEVGSGSANAGPPGKGAAGEGGSLGSGNPADKCMQQYLKHSAQCRSLHCDTYWISFFDNCDKWSLNLCLLNAQVVQDICIALAKGG